MKQFIFGGGTGIPTWEDLQHRRQIADALMAKAGQAAPKSWGEGVSAVGQALAGRVMDHRVGKQEEAEKARAAEQFQGIFGGGGMGTIAGAQTGFTGQGTGPASSMGAAPSQQPAPDWGNAPQIDGIDFSLTEQQYGLPSGYLARTAQIESGGDPNAKNPNSSASGLFQFIDSTAQQYGINPMDPAQATDAAGRLAADNAKRLQAVLGRPATSGELYLAHQQGGGGATKLLSNPDALAADLVGPDAVRLNGGDPATMSAREFAGMWTGKFDGGAPAATAGQGMDLARVTQLSELASNPYLPEGQRAVVNALLQQAMTPAPAMDPYQQANLDLQRQKFDFERQQAEAEASAGPSPDERYKVVGGRLVDVYAEGGPQTVIAGSENAQSAIGKLRADLDAGRITQEQFDMAMQNMAPPGMSIESDGQGGFRMIQGTNVVGRPLTESQSKDNVYSTRAKGALADLEKYGESLASWGQRATEAVPFDLGRFAQTPEFQMGRNAGDEFLTAILRKDTGAAITNEEQQIYGRTYLPQPGDSPEVLARKREAQRRAIAALESGMSPEQILATERALGRGGSEAQPTDVAPDVGTSGRNTPRTAPPSAPPGLTDEDMQFLNGG